MANDFDLGKSTSYAYYVSEGGTKTPQEFGEMLVNIDTVASRAEESASDAEESATSANESKESAIGAKDIAIAKANEASASADIALNKAGEASASATTASTKASEASASATTASAKATESSQNALTAVGAKNDAVSAKNDAVTAKTQAVSAKDDAVTAKLGAESARDEVQSSADQITQNASDISQLKSDLSNVNNQIVNYSELYVDGKTVISPKYLNKNSSGGKPTSNSNTRLISEPITMPPESTGTITKSTGTSVTVYRFDETDTLIDVVYAGASGTETPFDHCDHIRVAVQYSNSDPITPSDGLTITTLKFRYNNPVDALYENESISMDAFLLKDKVPTQYLSKSAYPSTFDDDEYLEKKIATVPLGKKLIFITDTHWESNEKNTVPLLDYVRRRLSVSKVVFGGDAIDRQSTGFLGKSMYANFMYDMKRAFGKDFIAAVGNHETNESGMKSSTYTDEERAEKLIPFSQMQPILNQDILKYIHTEYDDVSSSLSNYASGSNLLELAAYFKTIYYYDDAINQIRYIVLNTGNPGGLSNDNGGGLGVISDIFHTGYKDELRLQFDWFAASLLNTPKDYDVIVIGHQFADQTAELNLSQYTSEIIGKLCSAAMMRASVTVTPRNVGDNWANLRTWYSNGDHAYNFSKAHMKSIIMVCGHEHFDGLKINGYNDNSEYVSAVYNGESLDQLTKGQIPLIVTTTDAYQRYTDAASGATQVPMELGTITDHAFDVLTYTNDGIIIKRFGAGNDRIIYM